MEHSFKIVTTCIFQLYTPMLIIILSVLLAVMIYNFVCCPAASRVSYPSLSSVLPRSPLPTYHGARRQAAASGTEIQMENRAFISLDVAVLATSGTFPSQTHAAYQKKVLWAFDDRRYRISVPRLVERAESLECSLIWLFIRVPSNTEC